MSRTQGAVNIVPLESRNQIASTAKADIRHLARQVDLVPREQFKELLKHQKNFLNWIDSRHQELLDAKRELAISTPNSRGPKDAIYIKYRWYAEQQLLLEAINAFEAFFKNTLINLGIAIQSYVPLDKIKGTVDAKTLWTARDPSLTACSLIFEHQLFHNLGTVDEVTHMLIENKRYNPANRTSRTKALQAIFQIRHTLSHNQGKITQSDSTKFAVLGYTATIGEVLDPSKDHFGQVVRDLMLKECNDFTDWLLDKTAKYLSNRYRSFGYLLQTNDKENIERLLGSHTSISNLPWT